MALRCSMFAYALVDYDNLVPSSEKPHAVAVEHSLDMLITELASHARERLDRPSELTIRLYGGWKTKANTFTTLGEYLLRATSKLVTRRNGMRVRPLLATSTLIRPSTHLSSTYRKDGDETRQKMVDGMLTSDLLFLSYKTDCPILVGTGDEDLLPALLWAGTSGNSTCLLRRKIHQAWHNESRLPSNLLHATLKLY